MILPSQWLAQNAPPWQLDLRSLGLFRVLLGVAALWHVSWRAADFSYWYAPDGFNTPLVRDLVLGFPNLSGLNFAEPWPAAVALGLAFVLSVLLLVGRSVRTVTPALALLFWSLNLHRLNIHGSEAEVLLWALIWASVLPTDRAFVWRRRPTEERPPSAPAQAANTYAGVAGLGLTLQVGLLYLLNSINKIDVGWEDGSILRYFLELGTYTRPFGALLLDLPAQWLSTLALAILFLEKIALFLLLLHWPITRLATVLALIGMHIGFGTAMSVGFYPFMCVVWLTALLPSEFWSFLTRSAGAVPAGHALLRASAATNLVAGLLLTFALVSNLWSVQGMPAQLRDPLRSMGLWQNWANFTGKGIVAGHPLVLTTQGGQTVDLYRRHIAGLPAQQIILEQPNYAPAQYGSHGPLNVFDWKRDSHKKFVELAYAARITDRQATEAAFKAVAQRLCKLEAAAGRGVGDLQVVWYDYETRHHERLWQGSCESQP